MKANWDVALSKATNNTGLGGLIRDSNEEVFVSFCNNFNPTANSELAETLALRKAMPIYWDLGLSIVLFEGDFLKVVKVATCFLPTENELRLNLYGIHHML